MFNKIRNYLIILGYIKPKHVSDKIKYLLSRIKKIDLYSQRASLVNITSLEPTIVKYIEMLRYINKHNLNTERITVKDISPSSNYVIKSPYWYSDDNQFLESNKTLQEFLEESLLLITWCEKNIGSSNLVASFNYRRLAPYYSNIKSIVEEILSMVT